MFYQSLNQESLRRINNIVTGFKNHPMYASYTIRSYCYDARAGVHAIEVGKGAQLINLWLFYLTNQHVEFSISDRPCANYNGKNYYIINFDGQWQLAEAR